LAWQELVSPTNVDYRAKRAKKDHLCSFVVAFMPQHATPMSWPGLTAVATGIVRTIVLRRAEIAWLCNHI
jgi:hypothetical protein